MDYYRLPNHPSSLVSDPLSILDSDELKVPYWEFLKTLLEPILSSLGDPSENDSHLSLKDRTTLDTRESNTRKETKLETEFFDALEVIGYSLSMSTVNNNNINGNTLSRDFSLLRSYLYHPHPRLLSPNLLSSILTSALQLPTLFPTGLLPILGTTKPSDKLQPPPVSHTVVLSSPQIICILCHMILGTLPNPPWPNASWSPSLAQAWFTDDGRGDREIKRAYIQVLLTYLEDTLLHVDDLEAEKSVAYRLVEYQGVQGVVDVDDGELLFLSLSSQNSPGIRNKRLVPLTVILLDEEDDDCEACFDVNVDEDEDEDDIEKTKTPTTELVQLVSANKEIGFGVAATQEERLFGAVPCLLPIVFFTPPLSPTQALLIYGTGTTVCARFKGHLRTARLDTVYTKMERKEEEEEPKDRTRKRKVGEAKDRTGRTFLFMDALEMDGEFHGRDRELQFVKRELRKLVTGFAALTKTKTKEEGRNDENEDKDEDERDGEEAKGARARGEKRIRVVLPPWGCGTFGGDLTVKLLLIWLAASIVVTSDQPTIPTIPSCDPNTLGKKKKGNDQDKTLFLPGLPEGQEEYYVGEGEEDGDEWRRKCRIELRFALRRDLWNGLDPKWRDALGRINGFTLQGAEDQTGHLPRDTLRVREEWDVGRLWDDVSSGECLGE
ncbi:hypothetical protein FRB91_001378 [Serendipita sp. 411]|nr:hypothetical protein FRB91_001378 [Serendipita sp. 411]